LKRILLIVAIITSILQASNFRDAMIYYKNGNFKEAKISFELAIKKDHSIQANFMLGKIYLYGEGILPDRKKAISYLEKSVQSGNLRATCFLSEAYLKNDTDKAKAILLLREGLKKNLKECKKIVRIYNIKFKQKASK